VTHLAQVAARADHHYRVSKGERDGRAVSAVIRLDRDGRVEELARMAGGVEISDATRAHAARMLEGG
jgi:DNA repair protein RecN (Recombination protein N)